jgi:hypothetical protein
MYVKAVHRTLVKLTPGFSRQRAIPIRFICQTFDRKKNFFLKWKSTNVQTHILSF